MKKIPFMLIVGDQEEQADSVSVRRHGQGDSGKMGMQEFVSHFKEAADLEKLK